MRLIVGLGNPGKEYENTRHNAGFRCVELLQKKLGFPPFKLQKKFLASISEGILQVATQKSVEDERVILAKPETFMNASGKSASLLFHFYKDNFISECCGCQQCERIGLENFLVVYDDVDLTLGKIRIRLHGSAGSHKGLQSVTHALGFSDFPRLRIGIESRGGSAPKEQDITSFVLSPFLSEEKPLLEEALEKASEAIFLSLKDLRGIKRAMDTYN